MIDINSFPFKLIRGKDVKISGVTSDSRKVEKGDLFVAYKGLQFDGHNFVNDAIEKGAVAVLCSPQYIIANDVENVSFYSVDFPEKWISILAAKLYLKFPVNLLGITGTNGKTSTALFIQQIWKYLHLSSVAIGTLGVNKINKLGKVEVDKTINTTPGAVEFIKILKNELDNNNNRFVAEISSHALEQNRVSGLKFNGCVITSFSQDHLDYHLTMDNYFKAKCLLFDLLNKDAPVVINADMERADDFIKEARDRNLKKIITFADYSNKCDADYKYRSYFINNEGYIEIIYKGRLYKSKFFGANTFQVANVVSALILLSECENKDISKLIPSLENMSHIPGRLEEVNISDKHIKTKIGFRCFVDYAHTPEAFEKVIISLQNLKNNDGKLVVVFGCGGNRDKEKRKIMGDIAASYADVIIVTDDNPRFENPDHIRLEIIEGINSNFRKPVLFEYANRLDAIQKAVLSAQDNDIILVAGKGHENYQIIGDKILHFDDKEVLISLLRDMI